ncbi:hypothetical protein ES708_24429 [subsurface metagenome]
MGMSQGALQQALAGQVARLDHNLIADQLDLGFPALQQNWIRNGDFEYWPDGVAVDPLSWVSAGAGLAIARSATRKIGDYSALLTSGGVACFIAQAINDFLYFRGRVVTLGCWVWCATAGKAQIEIDDGVTSAYSGFHTGGSTWEWLTVTRLVDAAAAQLIVRGRVEPTAELGYFDGMILVDQTEFVHVKAHEKYVIRDLPAWDFTLGAPFITNGVLQVNGLDCSAIVPFGAKAVHFNAQIRDDAAGSEFTIQRDAVNVANWCQLTTKVANISEYAHAIVACNSDRLFDYIGTNLVFNVINVGVAGWFI